MLLVNKLMAAPGHTETLEIVPLASKDTEQGPGCTEDLQQVPSAACTSPHPVWYL